MRTLVFPGSDRSCALAKKFGYDEWMISRFQQFIGDADEVEKFLETMEDRPPVQYLRANTLKIESEILWERLRSKGFELERTFLPEVCLVRKKTLPVGATTEYLLGYYYIQDLSSCIAVQELQADYNHTTLDMAAAPGGKTTFIAQKMNNQGCIIALEPDRNRIPSLVFNLARCGIMNTCVYMMPGNQIFDLNLKFDRVLLDAPCSGEGVIGKDPSRKTGRKPMDIESCVARQTTLIECALRVLKPNGVLIYSTCSFAPEENEFVVDSVINKFGDYIDLEPLKYGGSSGLSSFGKYAFHSSIKNTKRFYPHIDNTLGFYIAKLRLKRDIQD